MRPTPGKGGGAPHPMQPPWCSRGTGAVVSRRSLKLVVLHLVFSNLRRWRSTVINAAGSSTVEALFAYAAPSADPVKVDSTVRSPSVKPASIGMG